MTSTIEAPSVAAPEPDPFAARLDRAEAAEKQGRWAAARAEYEAILRSSDVPLDIRLAALRMLGRAHLEQGNRVEAADVLDAAVAAAEQAGRSEAIARAVNLQAILAQTEGDLSRAADLYAVARVRAESAGDMALVAMIDQNAGTVASIRGDTRSALESFHLSLDGYRTLGMDDYAGQVLNNMGLAFVELGAYRSAESAYAEALEKFNARGDEARAMDVAVNQVQLWIALRRFDKGQKQCDELLAASPGEVAPWMGEVYRHMGVISRERSDYAKADRYLARAAEFAEAAEDYLLTADVAEQQAELFWVEERHREMLGCLNRSRAIYSRLNAAHRIAEVERRNVGLEARFLDLAQRWGDSIEGADHYTRGHCERVATVACDLARRAGVGSADMFWFRLGALLHDIGKVIVPADVLNKPGKLTAEEWELMKRHPEEGLKLVANVDFPGDVRSMIRHHHERWDGSGYPDGLVGDASPLPARLLGLADVYDALTSTRPYRRALTHEEAVQTMLASEGQFDPALLPLFTEWARAHGPATSART